MMSMNIDAASMLHLYGKRSHGNSLRSLQNLLLERVTVDSLYLQWKFEDELLIFGYG